MTKIDAPQVLQSLSPKTEFGIFEKSWPAIKDAIDRKVTLFAIWRSLKEAGILSVTYPTFTRFTKKIRSAERVKQSSTIAVTSELIMTKEPASQSAASDRNSGDEASADKAHQILSASSSALDEARSSAAKKDYSKIGRYTALRSGK